VFAEQRPLVMIEDDEAAWRFFLARRIAFFQRLLDRPNIFNLPQFREKFEAITRRNLQREVARH